MSGVGRVWVPANCHGDPVTLHHDPDCERLKIARKVLEKPANVYPDGYADSCKICTPGEGVGGGR